MEVMISSSPPLSPPMDFNFNSTCTSPYTSAPSTPTHRFPTFFYSAPTSPNPFFHTLSGSLSTVPFNWEEKPGIPKSQINTATSSNYGDAEEEQLEDIDFAFDFSGQLEKSSVSADELFDGGKIKPLKPPPKFQNKSLDSPKSPKSPKNLIKEAFSPRYRKRDFNFDPFTAALEQTRKEKFDRGRERTIDSSNSRKATRSLSPLRVSDLLIEPEPEPESEQIKNPNSNSSFASFWYKKWKIKDLLLFRSASESRVTDKDQLKKYNLLKKTARQDQNSSFRSTDSVGSLSNRRKSGPLISAHELHYTAKRAVSEEMKRRTFLPYKQGLLGCLGFQQTVGEISKGFASSNSSMSRG